MTKECETVVSGEMQENLSLSDFNSRSPINPFYSAMEKAMQWEEDFFKETGLHFFDSIHPEYLDEYMKNWQEKHPHEKEIRLEFLDFFSMHGLESATNAKIELIENGMDYDSSPVFQRRNLLLVNKLRQLADSEDVWIASSGYMANIAALSAIIKRGVPVYFDREVHESCQSGIALARGGEIVRASVQMRLMLNNALSNWNEGKRDEQIIPNALVKFDECTQTFGFNHNDESDFEKYVSKFGPGLVVTEGVFSVRGEVINPKIIELAHKHNCVLFLDESHSMFGTTSGDFLMNRSFDFKADVITASGSKTGGSSAGFIFIQKSFVDKLQQNSGHSREVIVSALKKNMNPIIFSNAARPSELVSFMKKLDHSLENPEIGEKLRTTSTYIKQTLTEAEVRVDFDLQNLSDDGGAVKSPILFLECGNSARSIEIRDFLCAEFGLMGSIFMPPATKPYEAGVRFLLNEKFCCDDDKVSRFIYSLIATAERFGLSQKKEK